MKVRYKGREMKVIGRKSELYLLVIALFMAVFQDVIRIPGTALSGFRLLLPFVLILSIYHLKLTYMYFVFCACFCVLSIIQNYVFIQSYHFETDIDYVYMFKYIIHYVSIISIFIILRLIRENSKTVFFQLFYRGINIIGIALMVGYFFACREYNGVLVFDNRNNYGCALATVFPWFLIQAVNGKRIYWFLNGFMLCLLWWGDSKAVLLGIMIEIFIIFIIKISQKFDNRPKLIWLLLPSMMLIVLCIMLSPLKINGYKIRDMFLGMITRIINGKLYTGKVTSLTYRTNVTIHLLNVISQNGITGIGPGNSAKILKYLMPRAAKVYKATETLAPHNALLEFFCDCGIWAIVLCFYLGFKAFKFLLAPKSLNEIDIYFVALSLSLPIWVMSAAGVYTVYLLFIIIAWLYENKKTADEENMNFYLN